MVVVIYTQWIYLDCVTYAQRASFYTVMDATIVVWPEELELRLGVAVTWF